MSSTARVFEVRSAAAVLAVAALAGAVASACADAAAEVCADGQVCPAGTICVESAAQCVDPEQADACAGRADGSSCSTAAIGEGMCVGGVCFGPRCGNGVVEEQQGEACDDGNRIGGDGCSADCQSDERCGNGVVDPELGEECDCGGELDPAPGCDLPNDDVGGACRRDCLLHCGDGVVAVGEWCDYMAPEPPSCLDLDGDFDRGTATCSTTCSVESQADCGFIGWRTRRAPSAWTAADVAETAPGEGFAVVSSTFVSGGVIGRMENYQEVPYSAHSSGQFLAGVWALDYDYAVAVGREGAVVRWVDDVWYEDESGTTEDLYDVWGRGRDDVYAVGANGTVLHHDGGTWTPVAFPSDVTLRAVAGDGDVLYVAGDAGTLYSKSGSGWNDVSPPTSEQLRGIWSAGGLTVAVGAAGVIVEVRAGVPTLGRAQATTNLNSVWGSVEEGFFAVGDRGTLLGYDGTVWRSLSQGVGVIGSDAQDFLAVSGAAGQGDVVAVGANGLISFEGAAWSPTSSSTTATLLGLWGSAVDDVFAVGRNGVIVHHDGASWVHQSSGVTSDLVSVWGVASNDVFAVGDSGVVLRYDGVSWAPIDAGVSDALRGVWASAADDVYVVGDGGLVHFDGVSWSVVDLPEPFPGVRAQLHAVWGSSETEVWVIGPDGGYRFDGTSWTYYPQAAGDAIMGDETGWWSVDEWGQVVRYDGDSVVPDALSVGEPRLTAVAVNTNDGSVFIGGESSMLARWHGGGYAERLRALQTGDVAALFVIDDVVFVAGTDGALDVLYFQR